MELPSLIFLTFASLQVRSQLATHIPGTSGAMMSAQARGASAASDVSKAKMAMVERGQKLSDLEDRTEAMSLEAKQYAANAHNLMMTNKNKKWYNF